MNTCDPAPVRCFDPRDPLQSAADRSTWRPTNNGILIAATVLLADADDGPQPVSWDKVAALADLCDAADASEHARAGFAQREGTNAMLQTLLAKRSSSQADDGTSA
jgi:hypothetical protein